MKKQFNLLFFVLICSLLSAQDDLTQAKYLFYNGKYSACQSIVNHILNTDEITPEVMYLNAKCSKELFLTDAFFFI